MSWISVNKPSTPSSWSNVQSFLPVFDESDLTYDSPTQYYDGVNQAAWTKVAKPVGEVLIKVGSKMINGPIMPLTNSKVVDAGSRWTKVAKPS